MNKIIILRGLPYSGKTTWAIKRNEKEGQEFYIYDVQQELFNIAFGGPSEILEQRDAAMAKLKELMLIHENIIVDDNNLLPSRIKSILNIVKSFYEETGKSVHVTIKEFHTPVWLCLQRANKVLTITEFTKEFNVITRYYRLCKRKKIIYSDEENSKTDIQIH